MNWTARRIRWRYWRTSLAFWLGLILGIEGTILAGIGVVLLVQDGLFEIILLMAAFGGISGVAGYGLFCYAVCRGFRRSSLLLNGIPQVGVVTAIREDVLVNYWDHHPSYLQYAFLDELGTKHLGKSPYLVKDQHKRFQPGDPILVLADRDDPRRHEVDVDDVRQDDCAALLGKLGIGAADAMDGACVTPDESLRSDGRAEP